MANYLQFTTPSGENVQFQLTAAVAGQTTPYQATYTTAAAGQIYLKVFATGDRTNPITDYSTLVQGTMYDIEAFSDSACTIPVAITSWSGTNVTFVDYVFSADRRPMYVVGYATGTQPGAEITFGRGQAGFRKTPVTSASEADFEDPTQNGRIDWVNGDVADAISFGMERINISNPAGWTSISGSNSVWTALAGNKQPHYPSNFYTGMALTEATLFADVNSTAGAVTWATPYTVDGYSADCPNKGFSDTTPGDQKKAWKAAVSHVKTLVTTEGGTPEVIAYGGYRPLWTDNTYTDFDKTLLGYSKPSGSTAGWTGTGTSPGWTPEPGFDGPGGTSSSDETFSSWFDEEAAGLYDLGFQSIGLDTGKAAWENAEGMSLYGTTPYGDTAGSDRIMQVFNGYGMKPYFESVMTDRWTHMGSSYDAAKLVPMSGADAAAYTSGATWAFFGSWFGYVGAVEGSPAINTVLGNPSGISVYNPTGGDGTSTLGDPTLSGARVMGQDTEIHCIFRWSSAEIKDILDLTDGWVVLRQIMYDYHKAGIICSPGSNADDDYTDGSGTVVTAADFYGFIVDLYEGNITSRPEVYVPPTPRQVMTWVMSSTDNASSVTYTGDEIISTRANALQVGGGPRLFNGAYANTQGATNGSFASSGDCQTFWRQFSGRLRTDGGAWVSINDKNAGYLASASAQISYLNNGSNYQGYWPDPNAFTPLAAGQTIEFEIYDFGNMP